MDTRFKEYLLGEKYDWKSRPVEPRIKKQWVIIGNCFNWVSNSNKMWIRDLETRSILSVKGRCTSGLGSYWNLKSAKTKSQRCKPYIKSWNHLLVNWLVHALANWAIEPLKPCWQNIGKVFWGSAGWQIFLCSLAFVIYT